MRINSVLSGLSFECCLGSSLVFAQSERNLRVEFIVCNVIKIRIFRYFVETCVKLLKSALNLSLCQNISKVTISKIIKYQSICFFRKLSSIKGYIIRSVYALNILHLAKKLHIQLHKLSFNS